jgi:hypothetical protein
MTDLAWVDSLAEATITELASMNGPGLLLRAMEINTDEAEPIAGSVHARLLLALLRHGKITDSQASFAAHAWAFAQYPQDATTDDEWRQLFEVSGYLLNHTRSERPTEPLRLYRGSTEEFRGRWSWTSDPALAQAFADGSRKRPSGRVWTVCPPRDRLLSCYAAREGPEHIVDVTGLDIRPAD